MGLTYFRRYRMVADLSRHLNRPPEDIAGYTFVPYARRTLSDHGRAKAAGFEGEMDALVFESLASRDGTTRLMREIASRNEFVAEATWLCRTTDGQPVATIQGMVQQNRGSIQNLSVTPEHRGRRIATELIHRAAAGFRSHRIATITLEVTAENQSAINLYLRLGFEIECVTYKLADL